MRLKLLLPILLLVFAGASLVWMIGARIQESPGNSATPDHESRPVPVQVADIESGAIELRRTFTGSLDAHAELVVAPKVGGQVLELNVDLADTVKRGQVVARLESAEYVQALRQAQADVAVAQANLAEAESLLEISKRELERIENLRERGVTSASQRDLAKADQLAKQAHVEVTRAQLARAQAALETARIRLGYTEVTADWRGGDDERVVAGRLVDEGVTVSANTPLLRIVELDPVTAVFFVTERDYGLLHTGQRAELRTDAYPGEVFAGRVVRIAPVFRESARQAQVEMRVDNPKLRLKPGMFVRAGVILKRVADATIVPSQALVTRDGRNGIFVLAADAGAVAWREVQVGIRADERVQISGEGLNGRVVTLGQQLLDDGSTIVLPESRQASGS